MRWKKTITMIEAHAEGEVGRIVTGGVVDLPGSSMLDKMNYINREDDSLRHFLVFEPRGYAPMSTNLIFAPTHADADVGFLVLQSDKAHAMSGSNCICLITVLLETGMLEMTEPETRVIVDTPAGLVHARATCKNGKCERVTLDMTPAYADQLNVIVDVEGLGKVTLDIAFGGVFYALIDVAQFALQISPDNAGKLVNLGICIHRAVNNQLDIRHPQLHGVEGISYTMFNGYTDAGEMKGATILPPGRIDRSPCGTGNAARLAVMAARDQVKVGQSLIARSIIDSQFEVTVVAEQRVAGRPGILASISGRGWIHGIHQIGVDPTDPYPRGYTLADCWGDAVDLLG